MAVSAQSSFLRVSKEVLEFSPSCFNIFFSFFLSFTFLLFVSFLYCFPFLSEFLLFVPCLFLFPFLSELFLFHPGLFPFCHDYSFSFRSFRSFHLFFLSCLDYFFSSFSFIIINQSKKIL